MRLKSGLGLIKETFKSWSEDYAPSMGAALSYYTMFSIAPLLLIVIGVAGFVFGEEAVRGEVLGQLTGLMGEDGAHAVEGLLESVSKPSTSALATAFGFAALIFGATTVFGELQNALDRIWRAPARKKTSGLIALVRARLLSFGMILSLAFLLMVSLIISAALSALAKWWGPYFEGWSTVLEVLNFVVSFGLTTVLFALIYKVMPRVRVKWHDVWTGAVVTALLFMVGKTLIGLYIGRSGVTSGFGAAASLVVMLIWVYYSAQIFLLGAEFTWVYSNTFGSRKNVPVAEKEEGTMPVTRSAPEGGAGSSKGNTIDETATPLPPPAGAMRTRFADLHEIGSSPISRPSFLAGIALLSGAVVGYFAGQKVQIRQQLPP